MIQTVHSTVENPSNGETALIEIQTVVGLMSYLQSIAKDSRRRRETLSEIDNIIHREVHSQVDLVAVKTGDSIICYFFCKSEAALLFLYVTDVNGRLKKALRDVFRLVLDNADDIDVLRTSASLKVSKLKQRMTELRKDLGERRCLVPICQ